MEEEEGKPCTADEYFSSCLDDDGSRKNDTKASIKKYFPTRKCFTINMPASSSKLKQLESLTDDKLDGEFIKDMEKLNEFIYACEPKSLLSISTLSQAPIDGLVFGTTIKSYMECLKRESKMNVEMAITDASDRHNEKTVEKITKWLQDKISDIDLPVGRKEELQSNFFDIQAALIFKYRNEAYIFSKAFETKLIGNLKNEWDKLRRENSSQIQSICKRKLKRFSSIYIAAEDTYRGDDGYNRFKEDVRKLESHFYRSMQMYDKDELNEALQEFKEGIQDKKMEIYRRETKRKEDQQQERINAELEKRLEKRCSEMEQQNTLLRQAETEELEKALNAALSKATAEQIFSESRRYRCNIS